MALGFSSISELPISTQPSAQTGVYTLTADVGAFTITGTDANLEYGRLVAADAGSVTITGTDANLEYGRLVAADAGSVTITGTDATLLATRRITSDAGSFTITGTDANLEYNRLISADAGAVTITGTEAGLIYQSAGNFTISAEAGAVTITGTAATLEADRFLSAEVGAVTITGTAATLTWSGEPTGRVRDGDGGGSERAYRRRRKTGYRVYKWQIDSRSDLADVAEEIAAEVDNVPAEYVAEFVDANAGILALLGVDTDAIVSTVETAPPSMLSGVATVEMERIKAAIEEFMDEEAAIEMLLIA